MGAPICEGCALELSHFLEQDERERDPVLDSLEAVTGLSFAECRRRYYREAIAIFRLKTEFGIQPVLWQIGEHMDTQQLEAFVHAWIQAWNQRDLEAILSHYTEDVEFQSPLVAKLLGETSGTVRGKQSLREYFRKALDAFPGDLGIELLGFYRGVDSLVVHFQAKGRKAAEVMELNQDGKVRRAMAHGQA